MKAFLSSEVIAPHHCRGQGVPLLSSVLSSWYDSHPTRSRLALLPSWSNPTAGRAARPFGAVFPVGVLSLLGRLVGPDCAVPRAAMEVSSGGILDKGTWARGWLRCNCGHLRVGKVVPSIHPTVKVTLLHSSL